MLIDSHCHLDYLERAGEDLDEIVARAARAGVGILVTICTKVSEFDTIRGIAERYGNVYCSVGIHPHEAAAEPVVTLDQLVELASHPKVVAIGESGLDYFYEHSPRDAQQQSFRTHIAAARETGLPLVVHTRDADEDTIAILRDEYEKGPFPGLIHCFSSSDWLAREAVSMGFSISLSGILTFKSAGAIRDAVLGLSPDNLLVETDAPYLAPVPKRGKQNEPAYVVHTAAYLADMLSLPNEEVAEVTTRNFFSLFRKVDPTAAIAA